MLQVRKFIAILVVHLTDASFVRTAFTAPSASFIKKTSASIEQLCQKPITTSPPTCSTRHSRLQLRSTTDISNVDSSQNKLHLLTFDLDDTIFPIGCVVQDANDAMVQMIHRLGYNGVSNDDIIAASKQIRTELREAGEVITYTSLRKQSIRREIERLMGWQSDRVVHDSVVEIIFDAWLSERHASADRNLYPTTIEALEEIRTQHPNVVIGAITNGRGNPLDMPSIVSYFDFCVSGEDEDVFPRRKPDEGIYAAGIRKYCELQGKKIPDGSEELGLNWIHVGDDLANDVGASASCGAKAVWFTDDSEETDGLPSWSTATAEELLKRARLDEKAREHVSAKISRLEELPRAISTILISGN